jgi:thiamine biosynthesis protein ThiS
MTHEKYVSRNSRLVLIMTLTINGESRSFENVSTLATLIDALNLKGDRVAVELNREIVPRAQWEATTIKGGDKLEIVHFVGGGR